MASTVEVLCPNGRRQTVKITPNSKLLQVLEEVCKKQGYDPSEYDLRHGRNILDLFLAIRYTSVPNNAKLELTKAEKSRVEENVHIALDVKNEDGSYSRLQHEFPPPSTLWDILLHFQASSDSKTFTQCNTQLTPPEQLVCSYLREELIGENSLKSTTLKILGLTGGRAVIRLSKRQIDPHVMAEIEEALHKAKQKQERLEIIAAQKRLEMLSSATAMRTDEMKQDSSSVDERPCSAPMEVNSAPHSPSQSAQQPAGKDRLQGVPKATNITGTEMFAPHTSEPRTPEERQAQKQARALMAQMGMRGASSTSTHSQASAFSSQFEFMNFKFPEETKGKDVYHNELSEYSREQYEKYKMNCLLKPCDRQSIIFSSEDHLPHTSEATEDLPDNFFEPTEQDIRKRQADLQKQVADLDSQQLMTHAIREQRLEELYGKYKNVVIRVVFPDKFVLQGVFRPQETVYALEKFVRENLESKELQFQLYTSPPKQILNDITQNMIQAKLAPASNVYFKSVSQQDHYLRQPLLEAVTSRLEAEKSLLNLFPTSLHKDDQSVKWNRGAGKHATRVDENTPSRSEPGRQESGAPVTSKPSNSIIKKEGVPKWLKLGKS